MDWRHSGLTITAPAFFTCNVWNGLCRWTTCETEACGLPIVSAHGFREGEAGLHVEHSDPHGLADAILQLRISATQWSGKFRVRRNPIVLGPYHHASFEQDERRR